MKHLLTVTFLFFFLLNIHAQQKNTDVCKEGDCSSDIFKIQLNQPLNPIVPNEYSQTRTEAFKQAYLSFQTIQASYAQKDSWKEKRNESQLRGKSCLRHYQIEAQITYEYVHNPAFKKFIDSKITDSRSFVKNGFQSSRKGLNLSKRMSSKCDKELEELEQKPGPSLSELPKNYQKLGEDLGYFDAEGKLMKPLDISSFDGLDISKLSKKKQVKALKEQLGQMPFTQAMDDKISEMKNTVGAATPKLESLTKGLNQLNSNLGGLLPNLSGLSGNIGSATDKLGALNDIKSKFPNPDLFSGIGNLFGLGKGLSSKAKGLLDKANDIKGKLGDLTKRADKVKDDFQKKQSEIDQLKEDLNAIAKKKAELQAKLEEKPKKILDQLRTEVPDVVEKGNELLDKVMSEAKDKNTLSDELDELNKEREAIENQMKSLENQKDEISKEFEDLEQKKKEAEEFVEDLKKKKEKIDKLKEKLEDLKPENELKKQITDCEDGLKSMLTSITGLDEKQENVRNKLSGLLSLPEKYTSKLSGLKVMQTELKLPQNNIPVASDLITKIDGLLQKSAGIGNVVDSLKVNGGELQQKIESYDKLLDQLKSKYKAESGAIDGLQSELTALISEKTGIKTALENGLEKADELKGTVSDFIDRFNIFDKKTDCNEKGGIKDGIDELKENFRETEPKVEELKKEFDNVESAQNEMEKHTGEVEDKVREQIKKAEELKQKELAIKEEYGSEVKLDPVTVEEWSESFEVERPYWEAVFHPDDEVVEGQKGRYFEVKLKDANKNVKLLFGPGEYCMSKSDFRNKYGSTIGSFVTEALHSMKDSNQDKVKIFIQGSADNVGHKTFSGKLDQQFFYENISVLPQKDDPEKFASTPLSKEIPQTSFKNIHLPDLRAQYLKEMIKVYSKKFDPVVLEGVVKDIKDEGERNAIIYLYIPEELLIE